MSNKLPKSKFPAGHSRDDFKCFGPVATKDGNFANTMLADLGCFKQGDVDSNKFYHAAVVQSKLNGNYYAYFEYGRTGQTSNPQFQMIEGPSQALAQAEYEKQLHAKNDKRGQWVNLGALGTVLQPKPGKDCYLVRPQASRNTGLPDARNITAHTVTVVTTQKGQFDSESNKLIQDLKVGATEFARSAVVGDAIPTQDAIDKCRLILDEATRLNNQGNTKDILDLTGMAYSLIPKRKARKVALDSWILNPQNIALWRDDLDVYENAVSNQGVTTTISNLPFHLEFLNPQDKVCEYVRKFMHEGTRNKHGNVGKANIKNIWRVNREEHYRAFTQCQKDIRANSSEKPLHQKFRLDLDNDEQALYNGSGTWMLFHGTRSVNVGSILQTGLKLPRELSNVVITGAMFGPGLYTADDWKKSAGYCSMRGSYWAGGGGAIKGRGAFMFICDVILGNPYVATRSNAFTSPPKNHHSIYAKAGAGIQNNEFIVFDKNQLNLRYLVEFENG